MKNSHTRDLLKPISDYLGKWLTAADGNRWRVTACIRGVLFGRLDGKEANPLTKIPEPWSVEK